MTVITDSSQAGHPDDTGRVRVGRQGIFDASGQRLGHELLFRGLTAGEVPAPGSIEDQATSHVIAATFGDFGVTELGGGLPLYINMTRSFLVGELPMPFGPDGVVLEILENIPVDQQLIDSVTRLRGRGFRLALDDYLGEAERRPLLPLVDIVKLDMMGLQTPLEELVAHLRRDAPRATILAERVEDQQIVDECVSLGINTFQGYHFERPAVLETVRLTPSQIICLRLMQLLADPEVRVETLESVVTLDPGLSLRVLRTANSAMSASRRRITSLRQALAMLGSRTLGSWVMLTLLGGVGAERQEDLVEILTRASLCESLGELRDVDPATCYTAGMISGVAHTLQVPLAQIATADLVGDELSQALLQGAGPVGGIVAAAADFDQEEGDPATSLGLTPLELSQYYLSAWAWARHTLNDMLV